jgi:predicted small integral membrane protein
MTHLGRRRVLASTAVVLATAQSIEGARYLADTRYLSVLLFLAAFLGLLAGVQVWRGAGFESRFTLGMLALSAVVGHTISLTVGLPGSTMNAWSGGHGAIGLISVVAAVAVLLMLLPRFTRNTPERGT